MAKRNSELGHVQSLDRPCISRREAVAGLAAGALMLSPLRASSRPARAPLAVRDWMLAPDQTPVVVPLDFLGLHSDHGVSSKAPPPTYPYDAIRSHDVDNGHDLPATQWADIEVKPGVYNWRMMDAWIATHPDKTRTFVLFGCPKFYQKYPNEPFVFPHRPGGGSPPKEPAMAARFIKALLDRYAGKIHFVEIWNEPNFGPGTDPERDRWTPDLGPGWFTGTASDLAAMARAVKAVLPPTVKLLAGAWAWQAKDDQLTPSNSVLRFAAAPDRSGGHGRDHVQALSVHLYVYNFDPTPLINEIRVYDGLFDQCGYPRTMERYSTESGAWDPGKFTHDEPAIDVKVANVKRWCMIPAAMGYKGVYLYKHSMLETLADPARRPEIAAAIAEMRNGLRGKTIVGAALLEDQSVWLAFGDGSELRA